MTLERQVVQANGDLHVPTSGKGLYDITAQVRRWVESQSVSNGLLTLFVQHTSASIIIQENADQDVQRDLAEFFERLVPEATSWFRHTIEGPDDMPSHIRSALTATSIAIPVRNGTLALGVWQAIYVFEHRVGQLRRNILMHLLGDSK